MKTIALPYPTYALIVGAFFALLVDTGCQRKLNPKTAFDPALVPPAPDYADMSCWAALPDKKDVADRTPTPALKDQQESADADVFFLHPTSLIGTKNTKKRRAWNGDLHDTLLNKNTDENVILYQATIFNSSGRIYAPRYRQAHLHAFFEKKDLESPEKALEIAYSDVKSAFEYYLKHWNNGRPIIIASHSQGSKHAMRILREYFEGKELGKQLIVAYIAGWPVPKDYFKTLPPCESPEQTGCFCTWRTYERNFALEKAAVFNPSDNIVVTNPLTWTTTGKEYAPKTLNKGAVLPKFKKISPNLCDAECHQGVLACTKPKFPGSFLIRTHNYHPGDFNLYYMNIRENAEIRTKVFLKK